MPRRVLLYRHQPAAIPDRITSYNVCYTKLLRNLFPEYKANRLKVPEELLAQIPMVKEVIDALGVPRIEVPGAEADDIIGTLSRLAEEKGMDVIIVSSDKDLYQLVSEKVRIRDSLKEKTVGEDEVRETFGVGPGQVADLLALAGDPSDNIPGVPGIGEKTASGLIREFGTVENLLARTDRLKGRITSYNVCYTKLLRVRMGVLLELGPEGDVVAHYVAPLCRASPRAADGGVAGTQGGDPRDCRVRRNPLYVPGRQSPTAGPPLLLQSVAVRGRTGIFRWATSSS